MILVLHIINERFPDVLVLFSVDVDGQFSLFTKQCTLTENRYNNIFLFYSLMLVDICGGEMMAVVIMKEHN